MSKKILIYTDDNDERRQGSFEVLELNQGFIQFKTDGGNIITLPISRLIKMKESSR
jgi:hypothetical protein